MESELCIIGDDIAFLQKMPQLDPAVIAEVCNGPFQEHLSSALHKALGQQY